MIEEEPYLLTDVPGIAVTKAKRIVDIIGTREAVRYAVETQNDDTRKSMLNGRMTIRK